MVKDIPFIDLEARMRGVQPLVMEAVARVCETAQFSGGTFVERFERDFSAFLGAPRFAGVSSGSDALFLALCALGVKPGDEVIVPAATFVATAFAVMRLGARPVFADCDPVTWQIDPESVERRVGSKTRAIIGVHLYGQAFPTDALRALAQPRGIKLIEDCAQSQGTVYRGRQAGTLSDAGCFSFYPTKNLGACGQAGGVACADPDVDRAVRILRAQGAQANGVHERVGYNMRLDGMQAAILSAMLGRLDAWNVRRSEIVGRYRAEVDNPALVFQGELPDTRPAWYVAVACVDDREAFLRHMRSRGILCGVHYPRPCHLQPATACLGHRAGDLPNSEYLAAHCVSLPLYPEMTGDQIDRVVEACNAYGAGKRQPAGT